MTVRRSRRAAIRVAIRSAVHIAAAVVVGGCAASGAGGGGGGGAVGAFGRRDDVRVIGSYADVRAVGVSRRYVFAATASGIGVYDRLFNTWLPPLSRATGLVDMQITFMSGDPVEDAVWLGVPGAVIMYRPQGELLQRTMLTGVPDYRGLRSRNGRRCLRARGRAVDTRLQGRHGHPGGGAARGQLARHAAHAHRRLRGAIRGCAAARRCCSATRWAIGRCDRIRC